jgi:hypothetical protein
MRKVLWTTTVVVVCVLGARAGFSDEPAGGCAATAENATQQLDKAAGDSVQALKDWLRACPSDDMMMRYALEIEKAKRARSDPPASPAADAAAAPQSGSEPTGTFVQRRNMSPEGGAEFGVFGWEQTVTLQKNGTAEITTKYMVDMLEGWQLFGCSEGQTKGLVLSKQTFSSTVEDSVIVLDPKGPAVMTQLEPACWRYPQSHGQVPGNIEGRSVLDWVGGRLMNAQGEYVQVN